MIISFPPAAWNHRLVAFSLLMSMAVWVGVAEQACGSCGDYLMPLGQADEARHGEVLLASTFQSIRLLPFTTGQLPCQGPACKGVPANEATIATPATQSRYVSDFVSLASSGAFDIEPRQVFGRPSIRLETVYKASRIFRPPIIHGYVNFGIQNRGVRSTHAI